MTTQERKNLNKAAPDLLAALKNIIDCWERENLCSDLVIEKAKTAIANAEGK